MVLASARPGARMRAATAIWRNETGIMFEQIRNSRLPKPAEFIMWGGYQMPYTPANKIVENQKRLFFGIFKRNSGPLTGAGSSLPDGIVSASGTGVFYPSESARR